jgi:hypothetical protein
MALALQELGIKVEHECWGPDGQVGFHAAVDLRGAKIGKPWREARSDDDILLHQVRHPLPTISSFQTAQDYTWDFVCEHCPEIKREAPLIQRCMQYWYHWNVMVEKITGMDIYGIYSIEKIDEAWPIICRAIEIPEDTPRPRETSKGWHKRGHTNLTWTDLLEADTALCTLIRQKALDYGYDLES